MEASQEQQSGADQQQETDSNGLTEEQRRQAEASATQGEQGEGPSQDPAPTGNFDPDRPVRNAPPSADETRQAAEAGRLQAPDAAGNRPEPGQGAAPERGEPAE
jgi:hypothetical protein